MKSLWFLSAFLLTVATAGAVWLFRLDKKKVEEIHPAALAVITDLVVTAGIGGAATLIFHNLKVIQEVREADRRLRCDTLREVLAAYNEVKEVRRLMRAEAI